VPRRHFLAHDYPGGNTTILKQISSSEECYKILGAFREGYLVVRLE
jgi:hypothetical protein